jgi:hypothetical protein
MRREHVATQPRRVHPPPPRRPDRCQIKIKLLLRSHSPTR